MTFATRFGVPLMAICLSAACEGAENEPKQSPADRSDSIVNPSKNNFDAAYSEAFKLINKSPDQYGRDDPNPAATVRAVNHLHSLGKERAIDVLRQYLRYAKLLSDEEDDNIPSQDRLCLIIPLLFVPSVEGARLPSLGRSPSRDETTNQWKVFNLVIKDDLPFHKSVIDIHGPPLPDRDYLVEWAENHGRLRDKRLRPNDDPLLVADEICESIAKEKRQEKPYDRSHRYFHIRLQAWRMIRHLIPQERGVDLELMSENLISDDAWIELKESVGKRGIHWNEKEQEYVAEKQ